jgi:hypothetical protein
MKTYLGQKLKDFKDSFDKTTSKGKYFQWWKGKLVNVKLSNIDESVNEAGSPIDFNWPKGNTSKEIEKLEAEYKAVIEKGSDILEKQKELIRKMYPGEFPWENYDKWPTKLKIEAEKLNLELEKNFEKSNEMGKKLFKLKGFNR